MCWKHKKNLFPIRADSARPASNHIYKNSATSRNKTKLLKVARPILFQRSLGGVQESQQDTDAALKVKCCRETGGDAGYGHDAHHEEVPA